MQRLRTALLVLAIAVPAAAAGLDAADLGVTHSLRRGLRSADQVLQAASKIFRGTVPKKDFQKVSMSMAMSMFVVNVAVNVNVNVFNVNVHVSDANH